MTLETHFDEVLGSLLGSNLAPEWPETANALSGTLHPPYGHLLPVLDEKEKSKKLFAGKSKITITKEQLIHCIDLTILDELASNEALDLLKDQAQSNEVAAVCVFSKHLYKFTPTEKVQLATVVNFPNGTEELQGSLDHIVHAKQLGATEIDYVLPYQRYLAGSKNQALASCKEVALACKNHQLTLKIILESGVFPNMQTVYQVSRELIDIGCDFLKTSTGKIPQGASLAAAFAMLSAIKDSGGSSCGIKLSGGVRTPEQAFNYAFLAELMMGKKIANNWFRLGASSLLNELLI